MGSCDLHFLCQLIQIHGQHQAVIAKQAGQQQDPGACKTKKEIMKNPVIPLFRHIPHQFFQALLGALQHEGDIAYVQNDSLGFSGGSRSIHDSDGSTVLQVPRSLRLCTQQ